MKAQTEDPGDRLRPLRRVRQVREFSGEPVTAEALDAIVDVARWSGSGQNRQAWRFITIRDADTLRRIGEAGLPSTRPFSTAGAAIAIAMPHEEGRAVSHAFDEGRAAERILIAASLLDLGAGLAWIRSEVRPIVAELLGIPSDRFVRSVVAIGHPTERARQPKSARGEARLPRDETVFSERWPA